MVGSQKGYPVIFLCVLRRMVYTVEHTFIPAEGIVTFGNLTFWNGLYYGIISPATSGGTSNIFSFDPSSGSVSTLSSIYNNPFGDLLLVIDPSGTFISYDSNSLISYNGYSQSSIQVMSTLFTAEDVIPYAYLIKPNNQPLGTFFGKTNTKLFSSNLGSSPNVLHLFSQSEVRQYLGITLNPNTGIIYGVISNGLFSYNTNDGSYNTYPSTQLFLSTPVLDNTTGLLYGLSTNDILCFNPQNGVFSTVFTFNETTGNNGNIMGSWDPLLDVSSGNMYIITARGGQHNNGTVFNGTIFSYNVRDGFVDILHNRSFPYNVTPISPGPRKRLVMDPSGALLYGMEEPTQSGPTFRASSIFSIPVSTHSFPARTTPAPTTPAPTAPAPTTPAPTTPAPTTPAPTTPAPTTPAPTTPALTTPAPITPAPTTPAPTTRARVINIDRDNIIRLNNGSTTERISEWTDNDLQDFERNILGSDTYATGTRLIMQCPKPTAFLSSLQTMPTIIQAVAAANGTTIDLSTLDKNIPILFPISTSHGIYLTDGVINPGVYIKLSIVSSRTYFSVDSSNKSVGDSYKVGKYTLDVWAIGGGLTSMSVGTTTIAPTTTRAPTTKRQLHTQIGKLCKTILAKTKDKKTSTTLKLNLNKLRQRLLTITVAQCGTLLSKNPAISTLLTKLNISSNAALKSLLTKINTWLRIPKRLPEKQTLFDKFFK